MPTLGRADGTDRGKASSSNESNFWDRLVVSKKLAAQTAWIVRVICRESSFASVWVAKSRIQATAADNEGSALGIIHCHHASLRRVNHIPAIVNGIKRVAVVRITATTAHVKHQ